MNKEQYMEAVGKSLVHTYNPFPMVIERGEGVYLYDTEGKQYLDFTSGYAVSSLGYHNEEWNEALQRQMEKICHTSNLFYQETTKEAAEALLRISDMDRIFFCNSGGEAVEGALKTARKYAYTKGSGRYSFIAMEESFHGRSFGAVSVTGHTSYRAPFEPLLSGVKFARFNDLESVKQLIDETTCAIVLETVQGEGGVHVADQTFLEGIRKLCDAHDILMICDEVQCGMGRTGSMFAWQRYGVRPDIMTMAKAIGNGFPVGAFAMTKKVAASSLEPGDHGTTYGGNPLACTAVAKTVEIFEREQICDHAREMGNYLKQSLEALIENNPFAVSCRGIGLMQALVIAKPVAKVTKRAEEQGLLLIGAGADAIRFIPPLIIEQKHIDAMCSILHEALLEA